MTNVFALIRPLDFSEYIVPLHTQEALTNYVQHGYMPGGFLTALLCNDLMGAVARADHINKQNLANIASFVFNEMPADSWGSLERMEAWCKKIHSMKNAELV